MGQGTVQLVVIMQHLWMPTAIKINRKKEDREKLNVCVHGKERLLLFQEHGSQGAVFLVCCQQQSSKAKATFNKLQIQTGHQWSLVIGSLAPCESLFHQTDITRYKLVPAFLLRSFTTQLYQYLKCYEVLKLVVQISLNNDVIYTWLHAGNVPEHSSDRLHMWKGLERKKSKNFTIQHYCPCSLPRLLLSSLAG